MEVVIGPSEELAVLAADAVQGVLLTRPRPVLGVATGSSPLSVYAELARRHVDEGLSFAHATAFLLDEYVGLPVDHPERYATVIGRDLASKVDLPVSAVHSPDGLATDLPEACRRYEEAITAAGGVDLQLLGIGTDGHVAFNEPTSSLASRTRIKTLTEQTRRDNSRFFGDDLDAVPHHVLTQGLGTIMQARHIVMLATGPTKAEAVRQMVEGPVSARWPATVLQLHPHVSVLVDPDAGSALELYDYYRQVRAGKPDWQGL